MKYFTLFFLTVFLALSIQLFAQESPQVGFVELMELSEEDYNMVLEARELTAIQNIPHTIYLKEGVFIEARAVENGKVVYAAIQNIVDIYDIKHSISVKVSSAKPVAVMSAGIIWFVKNHTFKVCRCC